MKEKIIKTIEKLETIQDDLGQLYRNTLKEKVITPAVKQKITENAEVVLKLSKTLETEIDKDKTSKIDPPFIANELAIDLKFVVDNFSLINFRSLHTFEVGLCFSLAEIEDIIFNYKTKWIPRIRDL